ncbi:NtaA/DmoA family FMN-dependent monooxygenase [Acidisphaera sp. L21]|uniref:NtaA/DmoA family FMN-dependent monooxygenase n=1 Tax=Acidisphaera sp. L21 TaxID=1641851 RepID=UPI00131E0CA5|nr:NtaA/DmoA family FMN-dependent monooxygenase [Acidisphaera sp. L21]
MPADKFHLAWFLQGSSIQAWNAQWTGNISEEWMSAEMFVDAARAIERAGFDYMLLEDSIYIGQNWQDLRDIFLKNGMSVPRQEPSVIASLMLAATSRLGVVPTLSTFAYHPYLTARIVGTLDQISGGRAGWNMVTGSSDYSGQNFGLDHLPEHDTRYEMAAEYIDIVTQLWDSWEPGAIVADRKTGVLIDPEKVHTIDFKGEHYASRGPLNSGPCPQGRPVIAQAGGSAKGRATAARYADTIVAHPKGIAAMKDYRDDVRGQMAAAGRNPDHCKVLFMAYPILASSAAEAQERADHRRVAAAQNLDMRLAQIGWTTNIDFSTFDLDAPVGELSTNGHQSSLAGFLRKAGKNTLREAAIDYSSMGACVDLVGTPDRVAAQMDEAMQEVGGDGFLIALPNVSRRSVAEITDGLVPALQQRGLVRTAYEHQMFRDNLLAF